MSAPLIRRFNARLRRLASDGGAGSSVGTGIVVFDRGLAMDGLSAPIAGRPLLWLGLAFDVIRGSHQIASALQRFGMDLPVPDFLNRGDDLLMPSGYHAGFTRSLLHPICATEPKHFAKIVFESDQP